MDPLAITAEIFVVGIIGAIFGGMAILVALDSLTDRKVLELHAVDHPLVNDTVQQIQPHLAQQAATNETAAIHRAA